MATVQKKRARENVDYLQLNSFSSAVLFDTAPRPKRSTFFEVERIITRRRIPHDYEYLIKWQGWPFQSSSWEPASNLTNDLLRNYDKPAINNDNRLEDQCRNFAVGVMSGLKSQSSNPIYINMDLDVWRFVTSGKGIAAEHRGHYLFEKDDLTRLKYLPDDWWYYLSQHGAGVAVDFPIKARPVLSWSPQKFIKTNGKLVKATRFPIEKVCLTLVRRACNTDNIL